VLNILDRKLSDHRPLSVLTRDLTYVRIAGRWAYTCLHLDLAIRKIISHAASWHKDGNLVIATFAFMAINLSISMSFTLTGAASLTVWK